MMVRLNLREAEPQDHAAIYALLLENGWGHRIPNIAALSALLLASQRKVVAEVDGQGIVGFARAITDGLSNGYLSMVVVAKPFRGRRIGRALIEEITRDSEGVTWLLRAGRPGAAEFFSALGFMASTEAMELKR